VKFFEILITILLLPFLIYGIMRTLVRIAEFRIGMFKTYSILRGQKKSQGKKESETEND
tara:strand:- start:540 stop:716 length:177 start_codon:yes stop_codon:yes gene_type:complete